MTPVVPPVQPSAYTPQVLQDVADDPLGRGAESFKKVPVFRFGFGGKFALCYPSLGMGGAYGQFGLGNGGVDAEEGDGRTVRIKNLKDVDPQMGMYSYPFFSVLFISL